MNKSQYLSAALDFIVEREEDNDYICEVLLDIPDEFDVCSKECKNLCVGCVLRFLKHYKNEDE